MCADPDVLLNRRAEIQDTHNPIKKLTLKQHTFRKKNFGIYFDVLDKELQVVHFHLNHSKHH